MYNVHICFKLSDIKQSDQEKDTAKKSSIICMAPAAWVIISNDKGS